MKVEADELLDACALHVLMTTDEPLTTDEILEKARNLTHEERLDALALFQESRET